MPCYAKIELHITDRAAAEAAMLELGAKLGEFSIVPDGATGALKVVIQRFAMKTVGGSTADFHKNFKQV